MRLVRELLSAKRHRSRGGVEGRRRRREEFGSREIEFHAPFILVAQTCTSIMHVYEHSFFFASGLLSDKLILQHVPPRALQLPCLMCVSVYFCVRISTFMLMHCFFFKHTYLIYVCERMFVCFVCLCFVCLSVRVKYVKTTFTFEIGTPDSTHIICTLAHLGWTRETHPHSTESPPSFLTGLETKKKKKREKRGEGESLSEALLFYFSSWHSLCRNLAEIIEVLRLLLVSPSVFPPFCLCRFQTRCQFEETQGVDAC